MEDKGRTREEWEPSWGATRELGIGGRCKRPASCSQLARPVPALERVQGMGRLAAIR